MGNYNVKLAIGKKCTKIVREQEDKDLRKQICHFKMNPHSHP
jgi:hypothetical protein